MYEVIYTGQFRRSLKLCARRGLNIQDFTTVLDILQEKGELPAQYRPMSCKASTRAVGSATSARLCRLPKQESRLTPYLETVRQATATDTRRYGYTLRFVLNRNRMQ